MNFLARLLGVTNNAEKDTLQHPDRLGFIADKYESGDSRFDSGTIGHIKGDPGGKSYGVYQLSLTKGTLKRYLTLSAFKASLADKAPGSIEFDEAWKSLAATDPEGFAEDQHKFIVRTHYKPAAEYAAEQGFLIKHRAVQEAVFSIAVQHGGYKLVIKKARHYRKLGDVESQVKALYRARTEYVKALSSLPQKLKSAIVKRYVKEEEEVLALCQSKHIPS